MANETFLNPKISYTLDIDKESEDKIFQPHVEISSVRKQDTNEAFVGATSYDIHNKGKGTHVLIDQFGNIMPTIGYALGPVTGIVLDDTFIPSSNWETGNPMWTTVGEVPLTAEDEYLIRDGRWLVTFTCRFSPVSGRNSFGFLNNIAGMCGIGITSTAEDNESIPLIRRNVVPMIGKHQTYITVSAVMDIPYKKGAEQKLIFKAFQTSNTALKTANRVTAVRIGNIPKHKKLGYEPGFEPINPIPIPFDPIFPKPEPITDPIPYPPVVDK